MAWGHAVGAKMKIWLGNCHSPRISPPTSSSSLLARVWVGRRQKGDDKSRDVAFLTTNESIYYLLLDSHTIRRQNNLLQYLAHLRPRWAYAN